LPNHIFVTGEARHFTFRVLIDTEEYECMHDILLRKWMCSESRDLVKFWEISDNMIISQKRCKIRDSCNGRL